MLVTLNLYFQKCNLIKLPGFRRCALKDGFEQLLNSLPNLYGCGTKPTNAIVLTRAAERIRQLKAEIVLDEEKIRQLKQNIQRLNDKIALVFFFCISCFFLFVFLVLILIKNLSLNKNSNFETFFKR